ncbi:hypothetical protein B0H17DRAFT_1133744 [Mycena rosella]|uniref:Uncharacterized protein n=1 Tax=Mycena rosella TaxID=1033263 RepID=A0AAD7GJ24_MYCRO|nr:hypothetical protein B0H17DRAFT_1133744 [Mycena rosella]
MNRAAGDAEICWDFPKGIRETALRDHGGYTTLLSRIRRESNNLCYVGSKCTNNEGPNCREAEVPAKSRARKIEPEPHTQNSSVPSLEKSGSRIVYSRKNRKGAKHGPGRCRGGAIRKQAGEGISDRIKKWSMKEHSSIPQQKSRLTQWNLFPNLALAANINTSVRSERRLRVSVLLHLFVRLNVRKDMLAQPLF